MLEQGLEGFGRCFGYIRGHAALIQRLARVVWGDGKKGRKCLKEEVERGKETKQ